MVDSKDNKGQVKKSEQAWRGQLSESEYQICREKGTERAFSGEYWDCKAPGTYHCRCCAQALFSSVAKYDSGSGWPSFYETIDKDVVASEFDNDHGMQRVEIHCLRCQSHLGHLFEDGPAPKGQRFCVNSLSLTFKADQ